MNRIAYSYIGISQNAIKHQCEPSVPASATVTFSYHLKALRLAISLKQETQML